jgi:excisionase family DNA binding protein
MDYHTERLLTAAETGQFLGLRIGTIRKMTSEGRLPVVRPTGTRCVRYRLSDLESLVRSRSIPLSEKN